MIFIKEINDAVWKALFRITDTATDNVAAVIYITAFLLAILLFAARRKRTYLPEFLYAASVGYMVERLPMIHERIHTALATTAGIILQSADYTRSFEAVSGLTNVSSKDIASYLYFCTDRKLVQPEALYTHFFRTMDKTRNLFFLGAVHETSVFWVVLLLLVGVAAVVYLGKTPFTRMVLAGTVIYTLTAGNNGAMFGCALLFFLEIVLENIFRASTEAGICVLDESVFPKSNLPY